MNGNRRAAHLPDTSYIALMGLLLALSLALTGVEYMIPTAGLLPPGVKLGLSNIVTMYCLFFLGRRPAFTVVFIKSGFVFLIRGLTAFCMSLAGGLLSAAAMMLLLMASARISYVGVSIAGAVTHNIGQLIVAAFLLHTSFVLLAYSYLPLLLISGVLMGVITGTLLRLLTPAFQAIRKSRPAAQKSRDRSNIRRS